MKPNLAVDPAKVLLMIRDGPAMNRRSLFDELVSVDVPPSFRSGIGNHCDIALNSLERAGLIKADSRGVFSVTPLLQSVQSALGISLTELSERTFDSIYVDPLFGNSAPGAKTPDVFVVMPFTDDLQPVYEDHIRAVSADLGLSVARGDDFFAAESIISDVWKAISNCKLVIADCTGKNPNVFYEIGIAHTVGKPTILVTQEIDHVPFDLRHRRCIEYSYTPRGMKEFESKLAMAISAEKGASR